MSLEIKKEIDYAKIKEIILNQKIKILQKISCKEVYFGDKITKGYKGITISLKYQSKERTLKDSDIEIIHKKVCESLVSKLDAVHR